MDVWSNIFYHPIFGVAITLLAYTLSLALNQRWSKLHPIIPCVGGLILFISLTPIPYEAYKMGGDVIAFFLGPATVALGVPLYKQAQVIKKHLLSILGGVSVGSLVGMFSAAYLVWLFGGSQEIFLSIIPKSVTSPIALEIAHKLGGIGELGVVFTAITGLIGGVVGPKFLKICGIRDDISIGLAMGTSSHGIGTARVIRESEIQGSFSSIAMVLAGIITSILAIPLYSWFQ